MNSEAIERLLGDFRRWLAEIPSDEAEAVASPLERPLDLSTLLGQFTALRHEVNLQTRATRTQQEQNAETLRVLTQSFDALSQTQEASKAEYQRALEEQLRPMLRSLIELNDVLSLAKKEVARVRDNLLPLLKQWASAEGDEPSPLRSIALPEIPTRRLSFWSRLFGAGRIVDEWKTWSHQVQSTVAQWQNHPTPADPSQSKERDDRRKTAERLQGFLSSLLTGYEMGLQRIERSLLQQGLEPMAVQGHVFDPESMEVLEAIEGSGRPAGEVLEEVRRGYRWRSRVFRVAQVRVART